MTGTEAAGADAGWSKRRVRLTLFGVGLLLLFGAPFWGPLLLRQLSFFRVRKVEIIGARYVPVSDIMDRLRVDTTVSVWDPTGPLVARLTSHPQLRSVSVRRRLPGTLVVEVQENPPIALVATNDGLRAYDARGTLLPIDLARTPIDAPIILPRRDIGLLQLLSVLRNEAPSLYDRVSEVRITAPDEVVFQMGSTPVRAMRDITPARLAEIAPVEDDLARRGFHAAEIDLRYRDQVIARLP
ncbi:MAG TPA: FtsQ-type POTRA domain-containing protein [Gemmatimonadaceae bacterium]|nr:FtsQ-type POTRA domain-containing protein [Gemmatimonadaceae bacterium]